MLPLSGSERHLLPGAKVLGPADPAERITVTVIVRRANADLHQQRLQAQQQLTREQFAAAHGASAADLDAVAAYARKYGIDVVETLPAQRRIVLGGRIADLSAAFGTSVVQVEHAGGRHRGRVGPLHVPEHLHGIIQTVAGFDDRPVVRPHFRKAAGVGTTNGTFAPTRIAELYDFPAGTDGSGQTIGILEFGGGYNDADLDAYFAQLGVNRPQVTSVAIDGAGNQPTGDPTSPDGEVGLDIEVIGAVAPGARQVVYFAPNTDQGFIDAVSSAVHDAANTPSVISISWGAAEDEWVAATRQAIDQAFEDAALLGVSVFAASGDSGSSDGVNDGLLHPDYPAASPWVTGCGGTTLVSANGGIADESTWNHGGGATGGGVSRLYPAPDYQATAAIPPAGDDGHAGRGVPDVAANADPATGYQVLIDGQQLVYGGTSAVAPLWAGLTARINQMNGGNAGFLNTRIYAIPPAAGAFHDIVSGNNDASGQGGPYQAQPGWDACTGLGSPDGAKLAASLAGVTPQPQPQPSPPPGGPKATTLAFRTSPGGVTIMPGMSRDLGVINVHGFERIRVVAEEHADNGASASIRLTMTEGTEPVGLLDVLPVASHAQITRVYEIPGTRLAISADAVGTAGAATVNVWVYGLGGSSGPG
ncbi:S53 family peptidase [Rhodovastum sp. RN2-1]|uniref:S53 family peptidase n=2 Tax=Limobrevibacterium gyesilva TaxID=2991712 RepID=A0AA41YKP7_9PROT|nr:S53 family peptidase [Limobrevibacterium gyesilva]MCW3475604.1 S53 family peptidase [Limobrevibacterium gyesilva]